MRLIVAEIPFCSVNVTVKFHLHPSVPDLAQGTKFGIDAMTLAGPFGVGVGVRVAVGNGVNVDVGVDVLVGVGVSVGV